METTNKIIISNKWNQYLWINGENILKSLEDITDEEIKSMWNELDEVLKSSSMHIKDCADSIGWENNNSIQRNILNEDEVLENLKKHIIVEKDKEFLWYTWTEVHIDLPAVWKFKWFNFNFFLSKSPRINQTQLEEDVELEKKLCSLNEISSVLKAINQYLKEYWVETDWDIDYEKRIYVPSEEINPKAYSSKAWMWISKVLNEEYLIYFLSDKWSTYNFKRAHAIWELDNYMYDTFKFFRQNWNIFYYADLCIRLPQ